MTAGDQAVPDGSCGPPEEGGVLDEPALDVAVIERQLELGEELCSLYQGDVGGEREGCDIVPVASDGCSVCTSSKAQSDRVPEPCQQPIGALRRQQAEIGLQDCHIHCVLILMQLISTLVHNISKQPDLTCNMMRGSD